MRIIGGTHRGRVLAEFPGSDIRPTADRVKESLFNILSPRIRGARVLDLFCGSGALGLESLSRGAAEAVFNDVSPGSVKVLEQNIKKLGVSCKVYRLDYLTCLGVLTTPFDIIFLDPPYRFDYALPALEQIGARGLLAEDGVVIYERDRPFTQRAEGFEVFDERNYGRTWLTFLRRKE